MSRERQVQELLLAVEQLLKQAGLWQSTAPEAQAFTSTEPFFIDTMTPLQWLQWVFLPRMQTLLDASAPLPSALAVAPYYEEALDADIPQRTELLRLLTALDALFAPAS